MPNVVIVDRITEQAPEYCVHGETWCACCNAAVWLGSETCKAVEGGAVPVCLECAEKHIPRETPRLGRLQDHGRRRRG